MKLKYSKIEINTTPMESKPINKTTYNSTVSKDRLIANRHQAKPYVYKKNTIYSIVRVMVKQCKFE